MSVLGSIFTWTRSVLVCVLFRRVADVSLGFIHTQPPPGWTFRHFTAFYLSSFILTLHPDLQCIISLIHVMEISAQVMNPEFSNCASLQDPFHETKSVLVKIKSLENFILQKMY